MIARLTIVGLIGLATLISGCAEKQLPSPTYLGGVTVHDSDDIDSTTTDAASSLRYVPSNKVLGAIAFEKVTGRTVDPARLTP